VKKVFKMPFRKLKHQILSLLQQDNLDDALATIVRMPLRQVVNPLFGLLYQGDPLVRWHAVTAMGAVTASLAIEEMESARIIMRRLMWNLNDESGGIGWGSPEAMGEIMACHPPLAREYAAILVSYLNPDGNFLEHEGLQRGVLWAVGRLARVQRQLVMDATQFLGPFLTSPVADHRGLAVWAAGALLTPQLRQFLQPLRSDIEQFELYVQHNIIRCTVGEMTKQILV